MIFFLFHIEIEGKGGWIIGEGAKGYVGPPLKLLGGGPGPPPPLPTPMMVIGKFCHLLKLASNLILCGALAGFEPVISL